MIKVKTVQVIAAGDWDNLVEKTYGRKYCLQQQQIGCMDRGSISIVVPTENPDDYENDSVAEELNGDEMGVSFAAWLARDLNEWNGEDSQYSWTIPMFWERSFYPSVDMLANDLYAKGLIPAGRYEINIDY